MITVLAFTLILLAASYCAGLLGSLTGLGGGVVVIPVLTLAFGVDFHYAIGGALVASIATSSGSGSAYVKEGITNVRLGMFLEIATTLGAVAEQFGDSRDLWLRAHSHGSHAAASQIRSRRCGGFGHGTATETLWLVAAEGWFGQALSVARCGRWFCRDVVGRSAFGNFGHR